MNYLSYLIIPLVFWCWHLRRELRHSRARERALAKKLVDTTDSLNPHFLFNALNTIRYFVRTNAATARELLLDLTLVLQAALRSEAQVSLRDELDSGRAYLRLEQARVGERLQTEDSVLDSQLDKLVPSRCLLPLLQSLVKGLAERSEGGTVKLSLEGTRLVLESSAAVNLPDELPADLTVTTTPHPRIEWRLP